MVAIDEISLTSKQGIDLIIITLVIVVVWMGIGAFLQWSQMQQCPATCAMTNQTWTGRMIPDLDTTANRFLCECAYEGEPINGS